MRGRLLSSPRRFAPSSALRAELSAIGFIFVAACASHAATNGGGTPGDGTTPPGETPGTTPPGETPGTPPGTPPPPGSTPPPPPPPGTPAVDYRGRFDMSDAANPSASWPAVRAIAQFDGTAASVKLSQTDGFSGGPTWFDVYVDGTLGTPFSVVGASEDHVLATGLAAGTHTVEVVKRTEANLGAVRFEGFTFPGGKLLAPPARPAHKIEFLSDSTIDGFGVEGDVTTTCGGGAPAQFNDADKSTAAVASQALSAEMMLLAYSDKGITKNEDGSTTDVFGDLYARTLPDGILPWTFTSFTPDVVVISLGGADLDAGAVPASFVTKYGALVDTIRSHYASAHVFCTVWSQIKAYDGSRQAMSAALQSVISARASDTKLYYYEFPEANHDTDETGCEYHGNVAHHQAMGTLLAAEIKAKTGW